MNKKSAVLALTLVWAVGFANISHAIVVDFQADFVADNAPISGMDFLTVDFGSNGRATNVNDVLSWVGDSGAATLIATSVDLIFSRGVLSGTIDGMIAGTPILVGDNWPVGGDGVGRFYVQLPNGFRVVGTNTIRAVKIVPEPASLALLSLGLFGLGMARRRRH